MGKQGFVWFFGLVEDVYDPLQVGRVKVRCYNFHSISDTVLPTEDLPWAHVVLPTTTASYQEKGISPTFLREGTTVVGFFADGMSAQMPIIFGTLPGIPQPTPDFVDAENISQQNHDVNRLARGINKLSQPTRPQLTVQLLWLLGVPLPQQTYFCPRYLLVVVMLLFGIQQLFLPLAKPCKGCRTLLQR